MLGFTAMLVTKLCHPNRTFFRRFRTSFTVGIMARLFYCELQRVKTRQSVFWKILIFFNLADFGLFKSIYKFSRVGHFQLNQKKISDSRFDTLQQRGKDPKGLRGSGKRHFIDETLLKEKYPGNGRKLRIRFI